MRFVIKYKRKFMITSFLQGTKLEELYFEETCLPYRREKIEYSAVIDPGGKPQVIREITHTWEPSYEEWCEEGIDHRQEDLQHRSYCDSDDSPPCKKYYRKICKQYAVKEYTTLNALMDDIYKYRCSIYFSKMFNEWVLSLGLDEDEFDYEEEYDDE